MSSSRVTRSTTCLSVGTRAGSVDGTTPRNTRSPASRAAPSSSYPAAARTSRSIDTARAPAPRSSPIGTSPAQQWATGVAPASTIAANTHSSASEARGGSTDRCRPNPDAVGTCAASTAGRTGSSTWTSSDAPGMRRRTSATCTRTPSARAWATSRRAPKSASSRSPRGRSTVAARVHGPATWTLSSPPASNDPASWASSSSASRSCASNERARRWSTPGASVSRQPAGCRSKPSSATTASDRAVMPAIAPRSGSSGRCGISGSSPSTVRTASWMSSPGSDPTPVATALAALPSAVTRAP